MVAFKVMVFVIMLLFAIYYAMVVLHLLGAFKLTNRKITFIRCIVPFYYWIANPESYK